jgi:uncharacterized cofD-like protein
LLSALEKMTGSFSEAVETASDILRVRGMVIPATLDNVRLKMTWGSQKSGEKSLILHGERVIDADHFKLDPRKAKVSLTPKPLPNPVALSAIEQADIILIAPGDLYTSLGPLLVIDGIGKALKNSKATKIYVCNLVTKHGQTDGFSVSNHAQEIERFAGTDFLDYVLYNKARPTREVAKRYKDEGAYLVRPDHKKKRSHYQVIGGEFLGKMADSHKADVLPVTRSLIRHDAKAVAKTIMQLYEKGME